jgi:hypothetical protein
MKIRGYIRLALVQSIVLLTTTYSSYSQQSHGWQTTELCHPCSPYSLGYGDSLHLFLPILDPNGRPFVVYTEDGGESWAHAVTPKDAYFHAPGGFEYVSFFPPDHYYVFGQTMVFTSTDAGESWAARGPLPGSFGGSMFNEAFGLRVFAQGNSINLRETNDSAYSFIDPVSHWGGESGLFNFVDSTRIWRGGSKYLFRSWDRGTIWDTITPFELSQDPVYYFLLETSDTNRVYVIGGPRNAYDYIFTDDGGRSWNKPSPVGGGRITRVAEQSLDSLWLLVCRRSTRARPILLRADQPEGFFADTLYYTQDGGKTWLKDLTFVGDTITDLIFKGPGEGYVVSTRDSTVKFSRYVGSPSMVEKRSYGYESGGMRIYPNPVSNEMQFYPRLGGACRVRILDVLGRCVNERDMDLIHMQATRLAISDRLSDGLYFLELVRGEARAGQRFLLRR